MADSAVSIKNITRLGDRIHHFVLCIALYCAPCCAVQLFVLFFMVCCATPCVVQLPVLCFALCCVFCRVVYAIACAFMNYRGRGCSVPDPGENIKIQGQNALPCITFCGAFVAYLIVLCMLSCCALHCVVLYFAFCVPLRCVHLYFVHVVVL